MLILYTPSAGLLWRSRRHENSHVQNVMTYRVPARTAALSLWCAHTKARCPTNTALRATHVVVVYTCKGCAARSKRAVYFFLQINCKHSPPIGVFSWVTCESILFAVGGCSISLFFLLSHQTLNFYPLIVAPHLLLWCDIVQHYTCLLYTSPSPRD